MYLYHGSTVHPDIVMKDGLRPLEPGEVIEAVLSEFTFKDKIPEQVVTYIHYELLYRSDQKSSLSKQSLQVHATASKRQAELYGKRTGGEFADNVRWACKRHLKREHIKEAPEVYVYVIDTGTWIPEQIGTAMKRCNESGVDFDELMSVASWDIPFNCITPEQIAGHYKVGGDLDANRLYR